MGVPGFIGNHNLRLVPKEKRLYTQSEETRKKRSESLKGRIPWNKGLKDCYSEETRKNWSDKRKGVKFEPRSADEWKQNLSNSLKGRDVWNKGNSKYEAPDYDIDKQCKCGCGENIIIAEHHRYNRIPDYRPGHQARNRSEETIDKIKENRKHQVLPIKDSSIEVALQKLLEKGNINFEKHKALKGQPDIFIEPNICIFADGDYWHANPDKYTDKDFIIGKRTAKDIWEKDDRVNKQLNNLGYKVLRFWEHEINNDLEECFHIIINNISRRENALL